MREFEYGRAESAEAAVATVTANPDARFLAGGSNLIDHLKLGLERPDVLVDVSRLPMDSIDVLGGGAGGVRIGANVRNSDLAAHPVIRSRYPVISRALLSGASGQIRHQATTAGNLLQRTRCVFFNDVSTPCNKREPGTGCSALDGFGRYNAILGTSSSCVAVHPSDLAVSLLAVDATVVVLGVDGERRIPLAELHRLPGNEPERDTTLRHGELITAIELPPSDDVPAALSTYYKVRDRASYAFALVSVAAGLRLEDGVVRDVRIGWGGVAHKPWRAERAEQALRGRPVSEESVRAAVGAELAAAETGPENRYKTTMISNVTVHALTSLAQRHRGAVDDEGGP